MALDTVHRVIKNLGLWYEPRKSKRFHILHLTRQTPEKCICVGIERIRVNDNRKYVGMTLNSILNYDKHFERLTPLVGIAHHLCRFLPKVSEPDKVHKL